MRDTQSPQESENVCAQCIYDEPGYVTVIGVSDHLCSRHWHCKPGCDHLDFIPKWKEAERNDQH